MFQCLLSVIVISLALLIRVCLWCKSELAIFTLLVISRCAFSVLIVTIRWRRHITTTMMWCIATAHIIRRSVAGA